MTDKFRFCRERKIDTSVDGLFAIGARGVIGKSENIERQRPGQLMFQLDVDRESGDLKKKFDEWQVRDNYLNMLMIKTNDMRCNRCENPEDVRKNKDWLIEMFHRFWQEVEDSCDCNYPCYEYEENDVKKYTQSQRKIVVDEKEISEIQL